MKFILANEANEADEKPILKLFFNETKISGHKSCANLVKWILGFWDADLRHWLAFYHGSRTRWMILTFILRIEDKYGAFSRFYKKWPSLELPAQSPPRIMRCFHQDAFLSPIRVPWGFLPLKQHIGFSSRGTRCGKTVIGPLRRLLPGSHRTLSDGCRKKTIGPDYLRTDMQSSEADTLAFRIQCRTNSSVRDAQSFLLTFPAMTSPQSVIFFNSKQHFFLLETEKAQFKAMFTRSVFEPAIWTI